MARSLFDAIVSILFGKVGVMVISAVFTPILVRMLGPSQYGQYATILSIFALVNVILTSGTNDAIRKFISERDDQKWRNDIFGSVGRLAILLWIIVAVGFLIGINSGVVESAFGSEYVPLFYLLIFYALGRQSREFLLRTLMGLQKELYTEPTRVLQKTTFAVLALFAAYHGYQVPGILAADIITSALISLILLIIISKEVDLRSLFRSSDTTLQKSSVYTYTVNTMIFVGCTTSLIHIDVLILRFNEPENVVGYYRGALVIAQTLWAGSFAIQLALLQRVSGLWEDNDISGIQERASQASRYAVLFTLLVIIGMAVLAHDFVPLYLGSGFQPAVLPLLLLLPGVLGFAIARPILAINQAQRSLRPLIAAAAGSAVLNIILNLLLIPIFGMTGAAIATSLSYFSLVMTQSVAARKLGYKPFQGIRLSRIFLIGIITTIPLFVLSRVIQSPVLSIIVVAPVGFCLFSGLAIQADLVPSEDLEQLELKLQAWR